MTHTLAAMALTAFLVFGAVDIPWNAIGAAAYWWKRLSD